MYKIIILLLLWIFVSNSCKNYGKGTDELDLAKRYYNVLDNSDCFKIGALISDSILVRDGDYIQKFSQNDYVQWLKWDSVFDPTYKILQIEQENGIVKAEISKMDKRIMFLHREPIVTTEIIRFNGNKIVSVERESVIFNETTFLKNRNDLLSWIDENHPELTGYLHDQTRTGGMKYLKAIELYEHAGKVRQYR